MTFLYTNKRLKERRSELRRGQTEAEKKLWSLIRGRGLESLRFLRQYSVGPYILDFYCPRRRLAIELDGSQHLEARQKAYDRARTDYLNSLDIKVLRFWSNDVLRNPEGIVEAILYFLTPPNLPLR